MVEMGEPRSGSRTAPCPPWEALSDPALRRTPVLDALFARKVPCPRATPWGGSRFSARQLCAQPVDGMSGFPEQSDFLNKPKIPNQETARTGGEDEQIAAMLCQCDVAAANTLGGKKPARWPQAALIPLQRPAARCEVPSGTGGGGSRIGLVCLAASGPHGLTATPQRPPAQGTQSGFHWLPDPVEIVVAWPVRCSHHIARHHPALDLEQRQEQQQRIANWRRRLLASVQDT
ncbi:hypothetical protein QBC47DRAFT_428029 [Echria macrotheca]|uniref:Uncharacterized protein n=1 Tax=Echria macrotheca TaxID=438768 RepID=A0AAJ0BLW1_9PEZI|nr:hypothetical protein QBC47DRAFT_428029 [Echria macrotheca]